jgi:hypothetical protein
VCALLFRAQPQCRITCLQAAMVARGFSVFAGTSEGGQAHEGSDIFGKVQFLPCLPTRCPARLWTPKHSAHPYTSIFTPVCSLVARDLHARRSRALDRRGNYCQYILVDFFVWEFMQVR